MIISTRYLFNPYLTPGVASVSALFDHFLFTSAAMTATALVTLLAWDGLAVDARDASVLGAMPIRTRTIVAAKFSALVRFAAMFAGGAQPGAERHRAGADGVEAAAVVRAAGGA